MRRACFYAIFPVAWVLSLGGLVGAVHATTLSGLVRDASSSAPVERAAVLLRGDSAGSSLRTLTDEAGHFSFDDVAPGLYTVVATRLGYERAALRDIHVGEAAPAELTLSLAPAALLMNPVVVSASRRMEKMLDSPSPTTVVDRRAIEERAARTLSEYLVGTPGVHAASASLGRQVISMRGFGGTLPRDLHTLVDYRIASLPTPRLSDAWFTSPVVDDLDRIEVVRGPGAALYGPNADRGVVHLLTRPPQDSPGTILRLGGGERDAFMGSLRHAGLLSPTWAYRISGQYFRGRDWSYVDPVEAARRSAAIAGGADPATLLIGARDPIAARATVDARADWHPGEGTAVTFSAGGADQIGECSPADIGALQLDGWLNGYGQVRVTRGNLFAQSYINVNDSGDSYLLRTGTPVVNKSRLYVGQVQHAATLGVREKLTYGLDAQRTDPRTDGTIHGRNEGDDAINEVGAYLHSETRLTSRLRGTAAIRVDHNNRLEDPVFSPRAAIVLQAAERHYVRLAYNRAYGTPDALDLFADGVLDSLPLPMAVRAVGVPETGFTFHRVGGVPYMRSPFTPPSAGGPFAFLPPDATLLWPAVVAIAQAQGADLSGVTPPTSAEVASNIAAQDPASGALVPFPEVRDVPRLAPMITNSVELGYQGWLGERVRFEASVYRSWIEDLISRFRLLTPNVFLDEPTLAAYLTSQGFAPGEAAALAAQLSHIPLGTITPEQAKDPADILLGARNFGLVQLWGADGGFTVQLAEPWSLSGTLTWVSRDLFPNLDGLEDVALNAPRLSGSLAMQYRDPGRLWGAKVRFRGSDSYPFQSGVYSGEIPAYALLDIALVWRPGHVSGVSFLLTADNVFDDRHREFIGAPEVGRVALLQVRRTF